MGPSGSQPRGLGNCLALNDLSTRGFVRQNRRQKARDERAFLFHRDVLMLSATL
jgi:hypothetical protein